MSTEKQKETLRELVERYLDAWNKRDVDGVLALLSPGAAVYDALWRESCVGKFLPQYIREGLEEDEYWYKLTDEPIFFDEGVVYRYAGYEWNGSDIGEKRLEGAEVVTVREGKIVTLSNYYYDSDPKVLVEVAKLSVSRHGVPTYVNAAYAGYKQARVKDRFFNMLASDKLIVDADVTVADLAEQLDCSSKYLLTLISEKFGISVENYIGRERTTRAADLVVN